MVKGDGRGKLQLMPVLLVLAGRLQSALVVEHFVRAFVVPERAADLAGNRVRQSEVVRDHDPEVVRCLDAPD